jgi:hypothetical protein
MYHSIQNGQTKKCSSLPPGILPARRAALCDQRVLMAR